LSDSEKEIQRLKDEKEREIEKRLSDTMESHYKSIELLKSEQIKQVIQILFEYSSDLKI
jgi:hypothetical protein